MIPVVLSGGSGTRLWPLSRTQYPKQFCELMTESLLSQTLRRLHSFGQPWVLTLSDLGHLTRRVFDERSLPTDRILMEPAARNTAPAIALICRLFELKGQQEEVLGVFPADHLVEKEETFKAAVQTAIQAAKEGRMVTLGIQPTSPATGFGYIETEPNTGASVHRVLKFCEKPDRQTAQAYLDSGRFFWNAGIFIFKISTLIDAFKNLAPDVWKPLTLLKQDLSNINEVYAKMPAISLDYAIMERLQEQACIPCDIGWSDLGSWDDIADLEEDGRHHKAGGAQFCNQAEVISVNSSNCFGMSADQKVVSFIDLQNVIAIDTPDALLLMKRGSSQNVREAVAQLAKVKHRSLHEHLFEVRPWGRFDVLRDEAHYKLKKITVDTNSQISYQSHALRSEHWIVVAGEGEVTLNGAVSRVEKGSYIFVPMQAKHRVRNTGLSPLEFIEVQTGSYFGEDDIIRYQDDYSRT